MSKKVLFESEIIYKLLANEEYSAALNILRNCDNKNKDGEYYRIYGIIFRYGLGEQINYSQAINYFHKSLELGNIKSTSDLGCVFNILNKYDLANQYFKSGIKNGQLLSYYKLGEAYEFGKGVKMNHLKSYSFFKTASKSGHLFSKLKIASFLIRAKFGKLKILCGIPYALYVISQICYVYIRYGIDDIRLIGPDKWH
jgi:tetratricopeptide (TPR) repeat protein